VARTITERNVNGAFTSGLLMLKFSGLREQSRNGGVLAYPEPVITTYLFPQERVLFNPVRDANPVFHLMEAIWMLAGEDKVDWLLQFNQRMQEYAEPDGRIWGAYGHRWRRAFSLDQIEMIVDLLQREPQTRQAVMTMWDVHLDLGAKKNDIPCNTQIYFDRRGGCLNMTVCCRSNDILWGAYGANVVHMSMLQELIAAALEIPMGQYRQFSNNFHIYTALPQAQMLIDSPPIDICDWYAESRVRPLAMVNHDRGETWQDFLDDCDNLVNGGHAGYATNFFLAIALPLFRAYTNRKKGLPYGEFSVMQADNDWVYAFKAWMNRRQGD
jgi:hypothetical protein